MLSTRSRQMSAVRTPMLHRPSIGGRVGAGWISRSFRTVGSIHIRRSPGGTHAGHDPLIGQTFRQKLRGYHPDDVKELIDRLVAENT